VSPSPSPPDTVVITVSRSRANFTGTDQELADGLVLDLATRLGIDPSKLHTTVVSSGDTITITVRADNPSDATAIKSELDTDSTQSGWDTRYGVTGSTLESSKSKKGSSKHGLSAGIIALIVILSICCCIIIVIVLVAIVFLGVKAANEGIFSGGGGCSSNPLYSPGH